jgi:hypothetical protein
MIQTLLQQTQRCTTTGSKLTTGPSLSPYYQNISPKINLNTVLIFLPLLPSGFLPSDFLTKILDSVLVCPNLVTFPAIVVCHNNTEILINQQLSILSAYMQIFFHLSF